ncbi:hypothetical protein EDD22DRAFT_954690 [Suillus occidentalis]|nr:hypothetical protein EDD22DRAFT_954690 [Suillus occidentalis]
MSCSSQPSAVSHHDDHVRDLCQLLEGMTVLNRLNNGHGYLEAQDCRRNNNLSKAPHMNSPCTNQTSSVPPLSASLRTHDPLPSSSDMRFFPPATRIALPALPAMQSPSNNVVIPTPNEINHHEVGVFFHWADVAERTNYVSGNVQKSYSSFQDALDVYTVKYNEGRVRAVPIPGGPFWPSPASPSSSSNSDELWSQVDDVSETMTHCDISY